MTMHDASHLSSGEPILNSTASVDISVTIGLATTGRGVILQRTIEHLAGLSDRPDHVVVSAASPKDADSDALVGMPFPVDVVYGPKGSAAQRNTLLAHANEAGVVFFIDDDFLISDGSITALRRLFANHPDVVMATGHVIADGVRGPGFDHAEGLRLLAGGSVAPDNTEPRDIYSTYGCNMAVRGAAVHAHSERFDAELPLYGWLEDLDFSRRMSRFGRIVTDENLRGVHLATKVGRTSGKRLGYSQIANPIYLVRKGSIHWARALKLMAGNVIANSFKSLRPEPWIDRKGRWHGNLLAFRDLLTGRLSPARILDF